MVDSAFLESAIDETRKKIRELGPRYEEAKSVPFDREPFVKNLVSLIENFDDKGHQPPSVEPYRLIWECKRIASEMRGPSVVREYEDAKSRLAVLSGQLKQLTGK